MSLRDKEKYKGTVFYSSGQAYCFYGEKERFRMQSEFDYLFTMFATSHVHSFC